ncbi:restriction endonuclease subunit S [Priestia megaterium]|uniref:restriction endonuclease subunit S n=1 Tax=Priestia megaterium TaxID=1404 RepID=UPI000BF8C1DA|nr:restriction endonuclease subunit S [Priestia megaterium]PEZ51237.1 restriction endonuclease subunit S [Priestia megaterium]
MLAKVNHVPSGYKTTELGEIPINWEVKKFTSVCTILKGQVSPLEEPFKSLPHIGNANVEKYTGKLLECRTAQEDNQISGKFFFKEEHVLYGKINPHFSKVAFPKFKGLCSADMYPIECKGDLIPIYLKYLLLEPRFTKYAISCSARTGIPKINRQELELFEFILPPKKEQQKIADILSTVDEKIENIDQLITKTRELKKGLMQKLLKKGIGHKEFKQSKLGDIPIEWESMLLKDVCEKITDGTHHSPISYPTGDYMYITAKNIKENKIVLDKISYVTKEVHQEIYKRCDVKKNDILYIKDGATTGIAAINNLNQEFSLLSSVALLRVKKNILSPKFLMYCLNSPDIKRTMIGMMSGNAITRLTLKKIQTGVVPLPTLEEQQKIAQILSSVDKQIESYEQEKEKYIELKKGLMQQLLTGKLRVTL